MKESTSDYKKFKFTKDNREKGVNARHVKDLMESIKGSNLLDQRPILVDENFNIIDGQHRLVAAQLLNVPIWYEVRKNANKLDIVRLSITKNWTTKDFLNFFVKNEYPEYIKLKTFMDKNELALTIAINIALGRNRVGLKDFREGKFKFDESKVNADIFMRRQTVELVKNEIGFQAFMETARFWKSLGVLIDHPDFLAEKWLFNLKILANRITPKATAKEYLEMFLKIYNFRNQNKITFKEEDLME